MTTTTSHGQVPAIQRYKIGYHSDEGGVRSLSPTSIYDDAGPWVRYEDHIAALRAQQPAPATQKLKGQICINDINQSAACAVGSVGTTSDAQTTRSTHDAPATQQAGEVVAYLDIGAGGYLDLGSALSDEALQQLPKGRHALVIAGTYGIAGYVAAPQPTPTAQAAESVTAPAGGGAVVEWHAPGLGEVHNESHDQLIFCTDGDDVADDTLARRVCAALNATPAAQAADSVPAIQGEMNVQLDTDSNHSAPGQQRDMACSLALGQPVGNGSDQVAGHPSAQGDKLLTVAERNIRSFLRSAPAQSVTAPSETTPHPACKPDMLVNGGALILALNVLRRAGKHEVAGELEATAQPIPTAQADIGPPDPHRDARQSR